VRVIGVIDVLGGRAVHARAGRREAYAPVRHVAGSSIEPGDALALARMYVTHFGLGELYVADLDAIMSERAAEGRPSPAVEALAALGTPIWLDAGVSSIDRARHALALGAARVIVGLETLRSFQDVEEICAAVGGHRVAFSLDLRNGEPMIRSDAIPLNPPAALAARAVSAGVGAVIVIDLARVGTNAGIDLDLITRLREAAPDVLLVAGGGVRGKDDLDRLAGAGCDRALVATALHDGRLGPSDVTVRLKPDTTSVAGRQPSVSR
jgi:phosphoribosylformimino-5-aminoimidazole carboxamide ribotide isomerase